MLRGNLSNVCAEDRFDDIERRFESHQQEFVRCSFLNFAIHFPHFFFLPTHVCYSPRTGKISSVFPNILLSLR